MGKSEYQVTVLFRLPGVIEVVVDAEDEQDAAEKAQEAVIRGDYDHDIAHCLRGMPLTRKDLEVDSIMPSGL